MSTPTITPRANTLIFVYVNTRDSAGNPINFFESDGTTVNEAVVKQNVILADTSGDSDNDDDGNEANYESQVPQGGTITWFGAVSNINNENARRDYIIINGVDEISPNGGISSPQRKPSQNPGQGIYGSYMQANVTGNPTIGPISYRLWFNIWWVNADGTSETPKRVYLDPILKIH